MGLWSDVSGSSRMPRVPPLKAGRGPPHRSGVDPMGRARTSRRGANPGRRRRRRLAVLVTAVTLLAAGAAACGAVGALHVTVTTAADGRDASIGDRVCEMTPGAGDCSLRAAVDETNVLPFTADTIDIAPGVA